MKKITLLGLMTLAAAFAQSGYSYPNTCYGGKTYTIRSFCQGERRAICKSGNVGKVESCRKNYACSQQSIYIKDAKATWGGGYTLYYSTCKLKNAI